MTRPPSPRGLTAAQKLELAAHLRQAIAPDDVAETMLGIDIAFQLAAGHLRWGSWLADEGRKERKVFGNHFSNMAILADKLRDALKWQAPREQDIDWRGFIDGLERLSTYAAQEATAESIKPGRPALDWRDSLVAAVYSAYPASTAKKGLGSNFERTVALLLGYLQKAGFNISEKEGPPTDKAEFMHRVVLQALKRCPQPHAIFRVHLEAAKKFKSRN